MKAKACTVCHISTGAAGASALLFVSGSGAANELANYNQLRNYVKAASGNGALLLGKTIGQFNHGGGNPYGNSSSVEYQNLSALVPVMQGNCPTPTPTPTGTPTPTPTPTPIGGFWSGVTMASDAATLAKASMLFASRNPTAAEYSAAAASPAALRSTLRSYMQGAAFDAFLDEVGDTVFMPQGVEVYQMGFGIDESQFPALKSLLDGFRASKTPLRDRFVNSIQREGVELMKYIVKNNKPWTDMVSGNYTVMNKLLYDYFGKSVNGTFSTPANDNQWLPGTWNEPTNGNAAREHAGVLSTHAWLFRFPTTETNRNRHRVLMMARQFLATDINQLAARPIDDGNNDFLVPTMQNPACTVCHDTMDPMAAGFQNWNERNRYLPYSDGGGKRIALPFPYRGATYPKKANGTKYYQAGDNWFRDMTTPGFFGTAMPGGYTGNKTALQWLGNKVATDSRFPLGAVHFWYQALFGRLPLRLPLDETNAQYPAQLAAFNAQNEEFTAIANKFASGTSGNGTFNVRDLLVELVMSKWARATTATNQTLNRKIELDQVNTSNMLSSAHLQRKLQALLGVGYSGFNLPHAGRGLLYGNFDGDNNTVRTKDHTILQTSTIDNLVSVLSCSAAQTDFGKAITNRLLFPSAALTDTPANAAGQNAIRQNIRHLHKWLLKEDLAANDPEIDRTYNLFVNIWNGRATAAPKPLTCVLNNTNDANYTGRAWAAVIAYLVGDPKFLFE